jgi:glutamate--cysteine ligase
MHSVDTMQALPVGSTENIPTDTTLTEVQPRLSEAAAEAWIPRTCFKNGPPSRLGVELELLVADAHRPDGLSAHFPQHRYPGLLAGLAHGGLDGLLTVEPGGQVELSSRPGQTLPATIDLVRRDLTALRKRAAQQGAELIGIGSDPYRPPLRTAQQPRYDAMEHYLAAWGPAGDVMMCSTASVQVNIEAGVAADTGPISPQPVSAFQDRWDLLHEIGPALVAAFANSSWRAGRPTGWKSSRQAVWLELDPSRTGVPAVRSGESLEDAYTRWALDAPLMLIRRDGGSWAAPAGISFRSWLRHGREVVGDRPPPTADDLAYHLTTLFPQVRPRGHYEVRFLDAQPDDWWTVPVAVIAGLLGDATAADQARADCAPTRGRWRAAAQVGVSDTDLFRSANSVLLTAVDALRRDRTNDPIADQVESYLERWTARGRCPADDPPPGSGANGGSANHGTAGAGKVANGGVISGAAGAPGAGTPEAASGAGSRAVSAASRADRTKGARDIDHDHLSGMNSSGDETR